MIVQLQDRKKMKKDLERFWVRLNDMKVTAYFINEESHVASDLKEFINNSNSGSRLEKLIESVDEMDSTISGMSFDDLEESINAVQEIIDHEYFSDSLFKKHIEAKDEDWSEEDEEADKD